MKLKQFTKNKKGFIADLKALGIGIVLLTIIVSLGATILGGMKEQQTDASLEENITVKGLEGLEDIGDWIPTIVIVVVAVVIIGLIMLLGAVRTKQ